MPTKLRYSKGHRGRAPLRPGSPAPRYRTDLAAVLPGFGSRVHNGPDAPADWGSDSNGSSHGQQLEGPAAQVNPNRNGGMRYFRAIDMADREDRLAQGKKSFKYAWRSITGPTPRVTVGDRQTARSYLHKIEQAIEHGGWTSSEAAGLYLARKVWSARAAGDDQRYNEVGNRQGGLTKFETANVKQRQIVADMRAALDNNGSRGD